MLPDSIPSAALRSLLLPPAIELIDLKKTFGTKVAVTDLCLSIPQGELVGLIGPNGAGKTTTIRMIMSILFPDSGRLSVLGKASAVESKDRIGYLPEERGLYKKMRVGDFLVYMARLKGLNGGMDAKVKSWLDRVGLADCARKKCEELSKGMQQKVQFVAAIIHEPDLVILDEPFSGLDPVNSRMLRTLLDEQHARGRTVIFSTHQMSQAEALCDRVVMIHQGRKVLDHTPAEIRSRFDPRAVLFEPVRPLPEGALAGVAAVERLETRQGLVTAYVREGAAATDVVGQVAAAVPCRRIEVVRPTLEDVFIDIVRANASDEDRANLLASLRSGAASAGEGGGD
jgi:ABC-2 type transport system ATP-binding protein